MLVEVYIFSFNKVHFKYRQEIGDHFVISRFVKPNRLSHQPKQSD